MKIELRIIDDTNKDDVVLLEVSDSQKEYIAVNEVSLETALNEEYREIARPFAIYADDKLVGFTMFAFELDSSDPNDRYWLWRFMIDKNLQRKGYGSAVKYISFGFLSCFRDIGHTMDFRSFYAQ